MEKSYILISNNDNLNHIDDNYIYKHIIILNFNIILADIITSFRDKTNIIEQFIVDCKRSNIVINNNICNYKQLNKYIRQYINDVNYYNYLICFTQALLSVPYCIIVNSTTKYVGELNNKEKEIIGDYDNIIIINTKVTIYKMLRVFTIVKDSDKTVYYIKLSVRFDLTNTPEDIYINFKILNNIYKDKYNY
jgi:hypothetical protein